jgi:hypothetical protein
VPRVVAVGYVVAALAVAGWYFGVPSIAKADPGTECAAALDGPGCVAIATRLDAILEELQATETVALSDGDAARLDLVWIGVFMCGGLTFGLVVGSWIKREQSGWGSRV